MMDTEQKIALFRKTLGCEGPAPLPSENLSDLPEWDSMGVFAFIVMLGKEYDRRVGLEDIAKLATVQDALDLMSR